MKKCLKYIFPYLFIVMLALLCSLEATHAASDTAGGDTLIKKTQAFFR